MADQLASINAAWEEEAFKLINSIMRKFGISSQEFIYFFEVMCDFKGNKNFPLLVARIKLLLCEHVDLIEQLNKFIPEEYKIALPLSASSNVEFGDATGFVMKLKEASSENKERFTSFLELFNEYHTAGISLTVLARKTCKLLQDRQDLVEEFITYLMDSDKEAMQVAVSNAAKEEGITLQTKYIGGYF